MGQLVLELFIICFISTYCTSVFVTVKNKIVNTKIQTIYSQLGKKTLFIIIGLFNIQSEIFLFMFIFPF